MDKQAFTEDELDEVRTLFGQNPEQLTLDVFQKTLRALRQKYHPDNFEKFDDASVRQMATERFQRLERLAGKLEGYLQKGPEYRTMTAGPEKTTGATLEKSMLHPQARFAYQAMKIEIRTGDKDLKYHIFGTFYRWLLQGEQYKIPETAAYLIADEAHQGHSIGFQETIRVYLTFEETDPLEPIVAWLIDKIASGADALLIEGEQVPIEYEAVLLAIKRRSFRRLEAGK